MTGSFLLDNEIILLLAATLFAILAVASLASPDPRRIDGATLAAACAGAIGGSLIGGLVLGEVDFVRLWLVSRQFMAEAWAGGAVLSAALGAWLLRWRRNRRR
jgi:integral membrane sensor domain MASE1